MTDIMRFRPVPPTDERASEDVCETCGLGGFARYGSDEGKWESAWAAKEDSA